LYCRRGRIGFKAIEEGAGRVGGEEFLDDGELVEVVGGVGGAFLV
jgi:hypothetical protein